MTNQVIAKPIADLYTEYAYQVDLRLINNYKEREFSSILGTEMSDWDRLNKIKGAEFKYSLILEALAEMFQDGFRPGTSLFTIILNFEQIFG